MWCKIYVSILLRRHRLVALALGLLTFLPQMAAAQDQAPNESESAESRDAVFRKRIVSEWNWSPKKGVALTTTEYARKYLERYLGPAKMPSWRYRRPFTRHLFPRASRLRDVTPDGVTRETYLKKEPYRKDSLFPQVLKARLSIGVVLFQTESLDIVVLRSSSGFGDAYFAIIDREAMTVMYETRVLASSTDMPSSPRFVDVDGTAPLELMHEFGALMRWLDVWSIDEGAEKLLTLQLRTYNLPECPAAFAELGWRSEYDDAIEIARKGGTFEIRVRESYSLHLMGNHDDGCVYRRFPSEEQGFFNPQLLRTCQWDAASESFRCDTQVVKRATIRFDDIKVAGNWKRDAMNIRWILANSEGLKSRGFRFPEGFLLRLEAHLPD